LSWPNGFSFVLNFQIAASEGYSACHNPTEQKNLVSREMILKIALVLRPSTAPPRSPRSEGKDAC
jgi:hypothetical protein